MKKNPLEKFFPNPSSITPQLIDLALKGEPEAAFQFALHIQMLADPGQHSPDVLKWFETSANAGHVDSKYWLGYISCDGIWVNKDLDRSERYLVEAADAGSEDAIRFLPTFYCLYRKQSVDNLRHLIFWLRKGAELNDADALFTLGTVLSKGDETNRREAFQHFLRAANLAHSRAADRVANAYASGSGVEKNYPHYVQWKNKAMGLARAKDAADAAEYDEHGKDGVPMDLAKATQLYREAAALGHEESRKWLLERNQAL